MKTLPGVLSLLAVSLALHAPGSASAQVSRGAPIAEIERAMERAWGEPREENRMIGTIIHVLRQVDRSDSPEDMDAIARKLVDLTVSTYGAANPDASGAKTRVDAVVNILVQSAIVPEGGRLSGRPYPGAASALLELARQLPDDGRASMVVGMAGAVAVEEDDLRGLADFVRSGRADSHWGVRSLRAIVAMEREGHAEAERLLYELHDERETLTRWSQREVDAFVRTQGLP